jgi:hypothetical protein
MNYPYSIIGDDYYLKIPKIDKYLKSTNNSKTNVIQRRIGIKAIASSGTAFLGAHVPRASPNHSFTVISIYLPNTAIGWRVGVITMPGIGAPFSNIAV